MRTTGNVVGVLFLAALFGPLAASAQEWDQPARAEAWLERESGGVLRINGESRGRYERRTGQSFGREPDLTTALYRNRLSVSYKPVAWLKLSGAVADSRAPGYGDNAPNTARDQADLFESYFELFPDRKTGFGMTAGRMALAYGETRLLSTSQWGNVARGFDHVRVYRRFARARIEFLWLAPVKVRLGEFNRPVLGDRVWGTYNTFPGLFGKQLADAYVLRHDQNCPGGYAGGSKANGTDRLGITTMGGRLAGPLPERLTYSLEGAIQTGKTGPANHRAAAWFSSLSRRWNVANRPVDLSGEYKYASGTKDPRDTSRTGTFDALYPSTHDKFGHMDLFGWRNIHTIRSQVTLGVTKSFSVSVMYDNWWLASARDSLYGSSGKSLARSMDGSAGSHVGQEADLFGTYRFQRLTFGAGYGHMFKGDFVRHTTPGVDPTYLYVFHTYTL